MNSREVKLQAMRKKSFWENYGTGWGWKCDDCKRFRSALRMHLRKTGREPLFLGGACYLHIISYQS